MGAVCKRCARDTAKPAKKIRSGNVDRDMDMESRANSSDMASSEICEVCLCV